MPRPEPGHTEQFDRRLDELVGDGWLLADDADEMRRESRKVDIP